ncbi:M14 family metallocarboxypeptidase [Amphibacillus sp. MSJ-3]|uniref:M14 family metallopeptidase n=1 Tax=Amphibacillus sp. MSJ-3 TaxID=2841505 RepID=UPI001C0EC25C|nr:M14 family metallocarboxypeptidase [Amphibacillus sp. MSJ-3]MBU5594027.1 M14 family metallocarboxypeptidase [Amphibacillus sp. MSJ-3]
MRNGLKKDDIYSYSKLKADLEALKEKFPEQIDLITIGSSVEGRNLYALRIGTGKKAILCHGAHHAREWLTTYLIMDFIDHLLTDCSWPWLTMREEWLADVSFCFIPMVNPDGVTLVQEGSEKSQYQKELISWNQGSTDFTSWKANSRGVDLNRQYPADWESIQADPGKPSPSHYKGNCPLSEPESRALYQFVQQNHFDCALAYHSSGEEIFWRYTLPDHLVHQHRSLAEKLAEVTCYQLIEPEGTPSGGGFTDWFLTEFKRPAFTIEIAPFIGPRPVPNHLYKQIFEANELVLYTIASHLRGD